MERSKIAFKIDTLFSKIHSISFLNKQCPFLKIYYDSKKASNLKFWLSFLQKTKKLKKRSILFSRNSNLSIITNDPYERTTLGNRLNYRSIRRKHVADPKICGQNISLKLKAVPRKLAFVPPREWRTSQEWGTGRATHSGRSKKEKQKAILWYIHGGTGGLATWRWVSDGAHNGQGRVGTVSFIEPTRPEYKILAVHFRDEITRPLLQPWRACLAIRRRLGRAWVVIHDFGGQEGEDLVARKQEKGD